MLVAKDFTGGQCQQEIMLLIKRMCWRKLIVYITKPTGDFDILKRGIKV